MDPEMARLRPHSSSATWYFGERSIPARSLFYSTASLLVPLVATVYFPDTADDYQLLLWLLALVPAFLLAYYRGWRGIATALSAAMAALTAAQVALLLLGRRIDNWPLLLGVTSAYILIALGIGLFSETLQRERERAERLALTDELTTVPNRRYGRLFLESEFAAARRGRPLVVALFDLDAFKLYNDRWGHQAGDDALVTFSKVLLRHTRRMNLSCRYGGEEFLSVVSSSDMEGALVFVDRVMRGLALTPPPHAPITVSVGLAAYHPAMENIDGLIDAADQALYEAKASGGNVVRIHGAGKDAGVEPTMVPTG
jgi:diguanylate cyclase (GGDEF)-like protein